MPQNICHRGTPKFIFTVIVNDKNDEGGRNEALREVDSLMESYLGSVVISVKYFFLSLSSKE